MKLKVFLCFLGLCGAYVWLHHSAWRNKTHHTDQPLYAIYWAIVWVKVQILNTFRVLLHGRITDGLVSTKPFWAQKRPWGPIWTHIGPIWAHMGPICAHMGPYGPAWARPGPTQYAKPLRELIVFWRKGSVLTNHVSTYRLSAPDPGPNLELFYCFWTF